MSKPEIDCSHLTLLAGSKTGELVQQQRLTCQGDHYCSRRLPSSLTACEGQDVSCVGPENSECPDPDAAQ